MVKKCENGDKMVLTDDGDRTGPPERATDGSCMPNNAQHPIFLVTVMMRIITMLMIIKIQK